MLGPELLHLTRSIMLEHARRYLRVNLHTLHVFISQGGPRAAPGAQLVPVLQEVLAPRYPGRRLWREGRDDREAVLLCRSIMLAESTEPIAARPFSRLRPQMAASHLPGVIALPGLIRYTDCAYWSVPPAGLRFCTGTTKAGGRPTASSTPGEHEIRSGSYRRTDSWTWCHRRCPALTSSIFYTRRAEGSCCSRVVAKASQNPVWRPHPHQRFLERRENSRSYGLGMASSLMGGCLLARQDAVIWRAPFCLHKQNLQGITASTCRLQNLQLHHQQLDDCHVTHHHRSLPRSALRQTTIGRPRLNQASITVFRAGQQAQAQAQTQTKVPFGDKGPCQPQLTSGALVRGTPAGLGAEHTIAASTAAVIHQKCIKITRGKAVLNSDGAK
ncbi:hypothetical protein CSOJ01_12466 [Colletotrichum sojae]|uniref:Uncharacterized protein n=1 Tax=Colletotrichum sojae TaxID=2175907 RepID=A0A8H6IVG5_9PEZI|nr:hypothetical protein CSOJ01_12466 [Colletotrichum sojae]